LKKIVMLSIALFVFLFALPVSAKQHVTDPETVKAEAVRAFEQILDLWRAGEYEKLYDRTLANGKETRESFSRRMTTSQLKPSCCWEKMQDVVVNVNSGVSVVIRAKIGLDAAGEMEYKTKSFKLNKEFGEWRIARTEILSLAEAGKAKKSRKPRITTVHP